MRIAIIGPGIMPIPPKDWGAVEILIWNYKVYLERMGHSVDIFNTKNLLSVAEAINSSNYDFVHLQYDDFIGFFNRALKKPYCASSHYGYLKDESLWNSSYKNIYINTLKAPGIIALSKEVADKYSFDGYKGFLRTLRNGCELERFKFKKVGNGKAICLGKIDPENRKHQAILSRILNGRVNIDFVGPMHNPDFKENGTCRYLGLWGKEYLYEHLTDYSCLVLISKGEVAPLVIPEALAAGLGVVVSETASANLDAKPYIRVMPDGCLNQDLLAAEINTMISDNPMMREEIREYARLHFNWDVMMKEYINIINDFRSKPRKCQSITIRSQLKFTINHRLRELFRSLLWKIKHVLKSIQIDIPQNRKYIQKQPCYSIAMIFIGIGEYIDYFQKYYKSCKKLFLPKTSKTYYVITDDVNHRHLLNKRDVIPIHVDKKEWPIPTLFRFKYINKIYEKLRRHSHVIFLDADMFINAPISEKEFFCHDKPLFGVMHPRIAVKQKGTFEERPASLACIRENEDLSTYWQGCLWGGRTEEVLKMSRESERRIDDDLSRGIIAVWHDESHLNKYFIENKDKVHTYPSSYAYPETSNSLFEKKIVHLLKDHNKMRELGQWFHLKT